MQSPHIHPVYRYVTPCFCNSTSCCLCCCRFVTMHTRSQCICTTAGRLTHTADTVYQLGGRIQRSYHSTQYHELWQWGKIFILSVKSLCTPNWVCLYYVEYKLPDSSIPVTGEIDTKHKPLLKSWKILTSLNPMQCIFWLKSALLSVFPESAEKKSISAIIIDHVYCSQVKPSCFILIEKLLVLVSQRALFVTSKFSLIANFDTLQPFC